MPNSDATRPATISTPEGDNEFAPDEPLGPLEDDALKTPLGFDQHDRTQAYKQDVPLEKRRDDSKHPKPEMLEKFVDEVGGGEYM